MKALGISFWEVIRRTTKESAVQHWYGFGGMAPRKRTPCDHLRGRLCQPLPKGIHRSPPSALSVRWLYHERCGHSPIARRGVVGAPRRALAGCTPGMPASRAGDLSPAPGGWAHIDIISHASRISQAKLSWSRVGTEEPAEVAPVNIPRGCCGQPTAYQASTTWP